MMVIKALPGFTSPSAWPRHPHTPLSDESERYSPRADCPPVRDRDRPRLRPDADGHGHGHGRGHGRPAPLRQHRRRRHHARCRDQHRRRVLDRGRRARDGPRLPVPRLRRAVRGRRRPVGHRRCPVRGRRRPRRGRRRRLRDPAARRRDRIGLDGRGRRGHGGPSHGPDRLPRGPRGRAPGHRAEWGARRQRRHPDPRRHVDLVVEPAALRHRRDPGLRRRCHARRRRRRLVGPGPEPAHAHQP